MVTSRQEGGNLEDSRVEMRCPESLMYEGIRGTKGLRW